MVEFLPSKQAVAGSNPVSRSTPTDALERGRQIHQSVPFEFAAPPSPSRTGVRIVIGDYESVRRRDRRDAARADAAHDDGGAARRQMSQASTIKTHYDTIRLKHPTGKRP